MVDGTITCRNWYSFTCHLHLELGKGHRWISISGKGTDSECERLMLATTLLRRTATLESKIPLKPVKNHYASEVSQR